MWLLNCYAAIVSWFHNAARMLYLLLWAGQPIMMGYLLEYWYFHLTEVPQIEKLIEKVTLSISYLKKKKRQDKEEGKKKSPGMSLSTRKGEEKKKDRTRKKKGRRSRFMRNPFWSQLLKHDFKVRIFTSLFRNFGKLNKINNISSIANNKDQYSGK